MSSSQSLMGIGSVSMILRTVRRVWFAGMGKGSEKEELSYC